MEELELEGAEMMLKVSVSEDNKNLRVNGLEEDMYEEIAKEQRGSNHSPFLSD